MAPSNRGFRIWLFTLLLAASAHAEKSYLLAPVNSLEFEAACSSLGGTFKKEWDYVLRHGASIDHFLCVRPSANNPLSFFSVNPLMVINGSPAVTIEGTWYVDENQLEDAFFSELRQAGDESGIQYLKENMESCRKKLGQPSILITEHKSTYSSKPICQILKGTPTQPEIVEKVRSTQIEEITVTEKDNVGPPQSTPSEEVNEPVWIDDFYKAFMEKIALAPGGNYADASIVARTDFEFYNGCFKKSLGERASDYVDAYVYLFGLIKKTGSSALDFPDNYEWFKDFLSKYANGNLLDMSANVISFYYSTQSQLSKYIEGWNALPTEVKGEIFCDLLGQMIADTAIILTIGKGLASKIVGKWVSVNLPRIYKILVRAGLQSRYLLEETKIKYIAEIPSETSKIKTLKNPLKAVEESRIPNVDPPHTVEPPHGVEPPNVIPHSEEVPKDFPYVQRTEPIAQITETSTKDAVIVQSKENFWTTVAEKLSKFRGNRLVDFKYIVKKSWLNKISETGNFYQTINRFKPVFQKVQTYWFAIERNQLKIVELRLKINQLWIKELQTQVLENPTRELKSILKSMKDSLKKRTPILKKPWNPGNTNISELEGSLNQMIETLDAENRVWAKKCAPYYDEYRNSFQSLVNLWTNGTPKQKAYAEKVLYKLQPEFNIDLFFKESGYKPFPEGANSTGPGYTHRSLGDLNKTVFDPYTEAKIKLSRMEAIREGLNLFRRFQPAHLMKNATYRLTTWTMGYLARKYPESAKIQGLEKIINQFFKIVADDRVALKHYPTIEFEFVESTAGIDEKLITLEKYASDDGEFLITFSRRIDEDLPAKWEELKARASAKGKTTLVEQMNKAKIAGEKLGKLDLSDLESGARKIELLVESASNILIYVGAEKLGLNPVELVIEHAPDIINELSGQETPEPPVIEQPAPVSH